MKSLKSSGKLKKRPRAKLFIVRIVRGDSMLPALKPGRIVVGTGRYAVLRPGDVVIIRHGGLEKIKRIQQINKDHLFLVGDNQEYSTDSRKFGWLHVSVVQAKIVWPRRLSPSRDRP